MVKCSYCGKDIRLGIDAFCRGELILCSDCNKKISKDVLEKREIEEEKNDIFKKEQKLEDVSKKEFEEDLKQEFKSVENIEMLGSIIAGIIILTGIIMIILGLSVESIGIFFTFIGFLTILGGVFLYSIVKIFCIMALNLIRITKRIDIIERRK